MLFLKQMVASIYTIILYVLVFVTLIDIILIYLIKNRKPLLENKYFDLHRRCGFLKLTAFKLVAALLVSYLILNPPLVPGATIVIVVYYFLIVTKLLIDFVRK
jgi:hypothetical protein